APLRVQRGKLTNSLHGLHSPRSRDLRGIRPAIGRKPLLEQVDDELRYRNPQPLGFVPSSFMKLRGDPRSEFGPGSDPWSTSRCAQRGEPPLELQHCNFCARVTYRASLSMSRICEGNCFRWEGEGCLTSSSVGGGHYVGD